MTDPLARIADALERLSAPPSAPIAIDGGRATIWRDGVLTPVAFRPLALDLLSGIDAQKAATVDNIRRHAQRFAAHDMLLWGARGAGKSALVKAAVAAVQDEGLPLLLVEVGGGETSALPALFARLAEEPRPIIVFIDDLGFEDAASARALRSVLEGGASARPDHVRLAVTSNRRHVVRRDHADEDAAVNARDVRDDELALADRFGLSLGFHACDQPAWLAMVDGYARAYGLAYDPLEAVRFATQRGARSGRIAWHYVVELAGRQGRALP